MNTTEITPAQEAQRFDAGQSLGWLDLVDSTSAESALAYVPRPRMVAGYPSWAGQGELLASGQVAGWTQADYAEAAHNGLRSAKIANLSPNWQWCSTADGERGALTWAQVRQFVAGRESYRPGTSTVYASLDNWPAVGSATRGRPPSWAWVALWPNYPSPAEVSEIEAELAAWCPGTVLAAIQYRNVSVRDVDLSVVIRSTWATIR